MKILKDLRIEIKKDIESYGYIDTAIEEAIQQSEEQYIRSHIIRARSN